MRILLVEDETLLAETIGRGLEVDGHVVVTASDGIEGLWHATEEQYDVVVLDIKSESARSSSVWAAVVGPVVGAATRCSFGGGDGA